MKLQFNGKAYGMDGVYWCMQFVWWCFPSRSLWTAAKRPPAAS